jgi:hypothetical protein
VADKAHVVGNVVAVLAIFLILGVAVVIWLVMIRAAKAQRTHTKRTDFGGRYSYFGFLLGTLRATDRQQQEDEVTPDASRAEGEGRSRR